MKNDRELSDSDEMYRFLVLPNNNYFKFKINCVYNMLKKILEKTLH